MGNSATSKIKGQGKVVLKTTFGKELTLTNIFYVLEIQKNLMSGSLLNNHGFRLVFKSNKFVLFESGMYIGKGYMSDSMWKLNVMTIIKSNMNKVSVTPPTPVLANKGGAKLYWDSLLAFSDIGGPKSYN